VQGIFAETGGVAAVGQQVAVVADHPHVDLVKLVVRCQRVHVQDDLLPGAGSDRLAAINGVLLAFPGSRVIGPGTHSHRRGGIGLIDPAQEFPVELVLQRRRRLHDRVGVGILVLQVLDDLRVLLAAQPVIIIDEPVAMNLGNLRDLRGDRRPGLVGLTMQQDEERHETKRGRGERQGATHHANPRFREKDMRSGLAMIANKVPARVHRHGVCSSACRSARELRRRRCEGVSRACPPHRARVPAPAAAPAVPPSAAPRRFPDAPHNRTAPPRDRG
jgi:hypothetical protein